MRVPSELVLLILAQSGIHIRPCSLRNWTRRGHISRTEDGYDLREIKSYVETRRSDLLSSSGDTLDRGELSLRSAGRHPTRSPR